MALRKFDLGKVKFVDAHTHVYEIKNYELSDVLPVVVGYSHKSNVKAVEYARKYGLPFVLGIAPQTAIRSDLSKLDEWIEFIRENKPNAIGEVGLDFHWAKSKEDVQKEEIVFMRMIELAEELNLPLVIHARKATKEVLDTLELREFRKEFMLHFFSGSSGDARRAVKRGGYISITPLHSKQRRKAIEQTEIERLLIETDAPYVGRKPGDVVRAAEYIAEVKNIEVEEVGEKTKDNASRFFGF